MEGFSLRHADAIMASGSGVADVVARTYGIAREKIDVVHCGVDVEMFCPAPPPGMLADRPTVLFVGKMVKNKGPLVMAEAVLTLRHKHPNIHAIFIGEGIDVPNMIRERFAEEGALDNLDLPGFVDLDKLPDFYRQAHAFMAPAEYEGFGAVYIEAQGCGCPVIASTSGGGSEAVVDGETGFLIAHDDVAAATARLEQLLGDAILRRRMSEAGIRRVRETFAMDRYIARVVAVYEKAVAYSRGLDDEDKDHTDWESPHLPGKHRREDW
jgi:phosphatidylinositol alpha-1,6-mannosyltransferase